MDQIPEIYYDRIRYDLLKLLPANASLENISDVRYGAGVTGEVLKKKIGAKNVIGLEVNKKYGNIRKKRRI